MGVVVKPHMYMLWIQPDKNKFYGRLWDKYSNFVRNPFSAIGLLAYIYMETTSRFCADVSGANGIYFSVGKTWVM